MHHKRILFPVVLALAAAILTTAAAAGTTRTATVKLRQTSLGQILADSHGKTLYLFAHDKGRTSRCYGACAAYWPPLITKNKPTAGRGVRKSLLGTTRRRDGRRQVTYHGHPLYRFSGDTGAGQTTGEGLTDFGGEWDAVSAAGVAVDNGAMPSGYLKHGYARFRHPKLKHGLLSIAGTRAGDRIALRLKAGDPNTLQVDVGDDGSADFSFDRRKITRLSVATGGGDDSVRIDESNGVFTDTIPTRIDGGPGNDNLAGGSGAETLLGGPGNDTIDGNKGNDTALLGPGDDVFVWDPGDASDVVEGQDGLDTMRFNGAAGAEQFTLSANGHRFRLFRDVGNVTMDTAGVETVDVNALGGADIVNLNDLTGTDVTNVNVDLASALGGTAGDAATDLVVVNGTAHNDAIQVAGDPSGVSVSGLRPHVSIQHQEPTDGLVVHGLDGADSIDASGLAANAIALQLDGDTGNDTIAGGQGVETSIGGDGNDTIDGNKGTDTALLGTGDDTFVWDPGDGSDIVEGQSGSDTMRFNGAAGAEQFTLSANGTRFKLFRDVGNVTMDTAGVETVDVNALGGADLVTVGDLTGTGVTKVNVDLASALGGTTGDGAFDHVVVTGTPGNDLLTLTGNSSGVQVAGLPATVAISHQEPTDRLDLDLLGGFDLVGTGGFVAGSILLFIDGIQQ